MKYNPGFLGDDELVEGFSAREDDLQAILEVVSESDGRSNQHVLVIGARGYGKTTLVLRVAAEVRRSPELSRRWFPLVFGEEAYEVESAAAFWLEALFHLHRLTSEPRWRIAYETLRAELDPERLRTRVLEELNAFLDAQHLDSPSLPRPRFLIVAENLQQIIQEQLSSSEVWTLRHTLQTECSVMLLATATARFESIDDPQEALYGFFRTFMLAPLNADDCGKIFGRITGQTLLPLQGRVLQILTGGNPRLVTIFASLPRRDLVSGLADELARLVDENTEFFRSNIESLTTVERRVFTALADFWRPVTAQEVGEASRLDLNDAMLVLRRLEARGAVSVIVNRPTRSLWQLSERLYNIFYLMRRSGMQSERVRYLVDFIVAYYYDGEALLAQTLRMVDDVQRVRPDQRRLMQNLISGLLGRLDGANKQTFLLRTSTEHLAMLSPSDPRSPDLLEQRNAAVREHEVFIHDVLGWFESHPLFASMRDIVVSLDPGWADFGVDLDATWMNRFSERIGESTTRIIEQLDPLLMQVARAVQSYSKMKEGPWLDTFVGICVAGFVIEDAHSVVRLVRSARQHLGQGGLHQVVDAYFDFVLPDLEDEVEGEPELDFEELSEEELDEEELDEEELDEEELDEEELDGEELDGEEPDEGDDPDEEELALINRLDDIVTSSGDDTWAPLAAAAILEFEGLEHAANEQLFRSAIIRRAPEICEVLVDAFRDLQEYEQEILFSPKYISLAPLLELGPWRFVMVASARFLLQRGVDFSIVLGVCEQCSRLSSAGDLGAQPALIRGFVLLGSVSTFAEGVVVLQSATMLPARDGQESFEIASALFYPLRKYRDSSRSLVESWERYVSDRSIPLSSYGDPKLVRRWLREVSGLLPSHPLRMTLIELHSGFADDDLEIIGCYPAPTRESLPLLVRKITSAVVHGRARDALVALRTSPHVRTTEALQAALMLVLEDEVSVPHEILEVAVDLRRVFEFFMGISSALGIGTDVVTVGAI